MSELRFICRAKRIPVSGTKGILIERLSSWSPPGDNATIAAPTTILSALMKSWFMAPFKSKACREGTLNKPFTLANFTSFVKTKSLELSASRAGPSIKHYSIKSAHEFELLYHKRDKNAAFSPDAIVGVHFESPLGCQDFVALVEMKSKCTNITLDAELELMRQYGEFQIIDVEENPMAFKLSIPDASYRCQLLHGMASGSLDSAFFVVASLRKIIRVVCISCVSELVREQYLSAIAGDLGRNYLAWIDDGDLPQGIEIEPGSHAVDRHSVLTTLLLRREMSRMII